MFYCKNCGKPQSDNSAFCSNCGTPLGAADKNVTAPQNFSSASQQPPSTTVDKIGAKNQTAGISTRKKKRSIAQIIISILALINVVFVPVFDVWGGLLPSNPEDTFFDAIGYALQGEFDFWVTRFTLALFVPSVFMLLFAILGLKKAAKISSAAGIALIIAGLIHFVFEYGISYLFDFDDGNLSIGLWIGLGLFIVMLFVRTKNKVILPQNFGYTLDNNEPTDEMKN